jgi:hypothetical protein
VDVQGECGDDDAGEGEEEDEETGHRLQVTGCRVRGWVWGNCMAPGKGDRIPMGTG